MLKNMHYIVISELPQEQQAAFRLWIRGKTMPCIEAEGANRYDCAFQWDYKYWLQNIFKRGQPVPLADNSSPVIYR